MLYGDKMRNKYLSYAKNIGIATVASILAGMGASELAKEFTDNGKIIGTISTISEYAASFGVFLPLQTRDNKEIYTENNKFNLGRFVKDYFKLAVSFALLDVAYVIGRPFLQDYFLRHGMGPSTSSLSADAFFTTGYFAAAIPLARLTGVIKKRKNLELKLEESKK